MKDSTMKQDVIPTFLRSPHGLWLNASGHVVKKEVINDHPELVSVEWQAKVVDTATGGDIEAYPPLGGSASVSNDEAARKHELQLTYMNACRRLDDTKPDVELLQKNVNAGIWDISITVNEEDDS